MDDLVVKEVVVVVRKRATDAQTPIDEGVQVIVVVVVVPAKVVLHALVAVGKEIVVRVVIPKLSQTSPSLLRRAIVVVDSLLAVVVSDKEVSAQLIIGLDHGWRAIADLRDIDLAIP